MASSRKTPRPDLLERAGCALARYAFSSSSRLCVALSGGLDSIVLLHLMARLREHRGFSLCAIHVHHGLSPHADLWAAFAQETAATWGVPCRVEYVEVVGRAEFGLEAAARHARYAVFERQDCDVLLLAQHRNDQAETVLLNALRGSGLDGLSAMPAARTLASGVELLRPLLAETRQSLLDYANHHDLRWVEDESNADLAYDRNFLRHQVLPGVQQVFPGALAALARVADHAAEAAALLVELAELDLAACEREGAFDLACAAALSGPRRRNALRHWLRGKGLVLDSRTFDELLAMVSAREDAVPVLIWRDRAVRRYRSRVYVTAAVLEPGAVVELRWSGGQGCEVPGWNGRLLWQYVEQGGLREDLLKEARIELRPRQGGERLRLHRNGPSRQVKHLWQEAGVAPWWRDAAPLVWLDGQLAAVPGVGVAEAFSGPGWQVKWLGT